MANSVVYPGQYTIKATTGGNEVADGFDGGRCGDGNGGAAS